MAIGAALRSLGFGVNHATPARLDARMLAASRLDLVLEREVAFGGFIHNFKSDARRGSENRHAAAA